MKSYAILDYFLAEIKSYKGIGIAYVTTASALNSGQQKEVEEASGNHILSADGNALSYGRKPDRRNGDPNRGPRGGQQHKNKVKRTDEAAYENTAVIAAVWKAIEKN